jgi:glycerol-3-phosphate dehydrogenase
MNSKDSHLFDAVIIGAGVIGAAIARELSKHKLKVALLERNTQVAQETSAGNSGVIHGGFDPTPGTLKATLNVLGRKIYEEEWFQELKFPHKKIDSLVLAFDEREKEDLHLLRKQGLANGLESHQLKILDVQECFALEPNLNPSVVAALLCRCSYIVDPVSLTESLVADILSNGGALFLGNSVRAIRKEPDQFFIEAATSLGEAAYQATFVVNAAGHYADVVAAMIDDRSFSLKARRGQYRILEKTERHVINSHVIFMVPTIHGKGVIVAPMLDGHLLVGPTAEEGIAKEDTRLVTIEKFEEIGLIGRKIIPSLRVEKTCGVVAGSRSIGLQTNDFIIEPSLRDRRFIHVAAISSPGLSAAPAIARKVVELINAHIEPRSVTEITEPQTHVIQSTAVG